MQRVPGCPSPSSTPPSAVLSPHPKLQDSTIIGAPRSPWISPVFPLTSLWSQHPSAPPHTACSPRVPSHASCPALPPFPGPLLTVGGVLVRCVRGAPRLRCRMVFLTVRLGAGEFAAEVARPPLHITSGTPDTHPRGALGAAAVTPAAPPRQGTACPFHPLLRSEPPSAAPLPGAGRKGDGLPHRMCHFSFMLEPF